MAKNNGYSVSVFDYNLDLVNALTEDEWDQFEAWNALSSDCISDELTEKLKIIFE